MPLKGALLLRAERSTIKIPCDSLYRSIDRTVSQAPGLCHFESQGELGLPTLLSFSSLSHVRFLPQGNGQAEARFLLKRRNKIEIYLVKSIMAETSTNLNIILAL